MKFNYINLTKLEDIKSESLDGKRFYNTPNGKYPSITTVFSSFPKPELDAWKNRVGDEEASRISRIAATKGTKLHLLCEKYLSNETIDNRKYFPDVLESFFRFKTFLHQIDNIHSLETPLYSNELKVAGRCDCIAEYKGKLSLIDFKTSSKEKKEEWITDYFLQAQFYAHAYEELTDIRVEKLVILISVNEGEQQEFIKDNGEYLEQLKEKVSEYYKYYHI